MEVQPLDRSFQGLEATPLDEQLPWKLPLNREQLHRLFTPFDRMAQLARIPNSKVVEAMSRLRRFSTTNLAWRDRWSQVYGLIMFNLIF